MGPSHGEQNTAEDPDGKWYTRSELDCIPEQEMKALRPLLAGPRIDPGASEELSPLVG